jgi:hypothetical protein
VGNVLVEAPAGLRERKKQRTRAMLIEAAIELCLELASVPPEIGPLEALRLAHVATLTRVAKRPSARLSDERIVLMLRVINASDALRQAANDYKHEPSHAFVAQRLGVPVDDRRVQLVGAIFSSVIVTACSDLIANTDGVRLGASVMIDRLNQSFTQLALFAADLRPPAEEPSYEAVNG